MDIRVELRHLRYFLAVAEELHFGHAAQRLRLAQPALSQQIRSLEEILGCRLFERKPRVALTEAGLALLEVSRRIFAQIEHGLEATGRAGRGETGTLNVGFAASAVLTSFPEVIKTYRAMFPDVTLQLRELTPTAEVEAIKDGIVDIGFVRELSSDEGLTYEVVSREPFGVLLPHKHPLAARKSISPDLLADEPFIHFTPEVAPTLYNQVIQICRGAGFLPRIVQEVREWLTHISLVGVGVGVALVPMSLQRIHWSGVTIRPLRNCPTRAMIALCYRSGNVPPNAKEFILLSMEMFKPKRKQR